MDVLVLPSNCDKLLQVKLPRPKDGQAQQFFYDDENIALYELTSYSDEYRSWFFDNSFCREGHLNLLTKVDQLFMFLPHLIEFVSNKFMSIEDICMEVNAKSQGRFSRINYALSPDANWYLVCDTQDVDGSLYIKYNQTKTVDWLLKKHERTMSALRKELDAKTSNATLMLHAIQLIQEYLPAELGDRFATDVKSRASGASSASMKFTQLPQPPLSKNGRKPSGLQKF